MRGPPWRACVRSLPTARRDRGSPSAGCREPRRGCSRKRGRNRKAQQESKSKGRDAAFAAVGVRPLLDLLFQGSNVREDQLLVSYGEALQVSEDLCHYRIVDWPR